MNQFTKKRKASDEEFICDDDDQLTVPFNDYTPCQSNGTPELPVERADALQSQLKRRLGMVSELMSIDRQLDWLRNFITPFVFTAPFTTRGAIFWHPLVLSYDVPQHGSQVPKFIFQLLEATAENHFGSYELQIIIDAIIVRRINGTLASWGVKIKDINEYIAAHASAALKAKVGNRIELLLKRPRRLLQPQTARPNGVPMQRMQPVLPYHSIIRQAPVSFKSK